jgi:hypothetical protein
MHDGHDLARLCFESCDFGTSQDLQSPDVLARSFRLFRMGTRMTLMLMCEGITPSVCGDLMIV